MSFLLRNVAKESERASSIALLNWILNKQFNELQHCRLVCVSVYECMFVSVCVCVCVCQSMHFQESLLMILMLANEKPEKKENSTALGSLAWKEFTMPEN